MHHLLLWCDLPLRSRALPDGDSNLGNWIGLLCRQVLSLWSSWSSWSLWSPWSLWSSWSTSSISRSWGLGECLPRGWSRLVELTRCLNSLSQVGFTTIWCCWQWRNHDDYKESIESLSSVWDLCSRWCCSRCLASRDPGQVSTILIRMLVILLHTYIVRISAEVVLCELSVWLYKELSKNIFKVAFFAGNCLTLLSCSFYIKLSCDFKELFKSIFFTGNCLTPWLRRRLSRWQMSSQAGGRRGQLEMSRLEKCILGSLRNMYSFLILKLIRKT